MVLEVDTGAFFYKRKCIQLLRLYTAKIWMKMLRASDSFFGVHGWVKASDNKVGAYLNPLYNLCPTIPSTLGDETLFGHYIRGVHLHIPPQK